MSIKRDYYEILGLAKEATEREIKTSYRRLAHELHPDKNPGNKEAEEKFKEASEAYSVLSNAEKRAQYDRFGHGGMHGSQQGGGFGVDFEDVFGDIFGDIFGGGSGGRSSRRRGQHGSDLRYDLSLSFEEAAFGLEKEISLKRLELCDSCEGTGSKSKAKPVECRTCSGIGEVRIAQGFFAVAQTCPSCKGSGQAIKDPCIDCRGSRLKQNTHKLSVKVPPGVDSGIKLRFSSEGNSGLDGGARGDLYIVLTVSKHPIFKRENYDVICDIPISFTQAVLGAEIEVPTLHGKVELNIPSGTPSGHVFKLFKKGIPVLRSRTNETGDQFVQVFVEIPKKLNTEQKKALEEFAELSGDETRPSQKSFFDKVKELFD